MAGPSDLAEMKALEATQDAHAKNPQVHYGTAYTPATWRAVCAAVWEHVGIRITKTQAIRIAARLSLTTENQS